MVNAMALSGGSSADGLLSLINSRRVILCVGCGGVGKTTTTAALGLAAAQRGKRVLCLTIDPARRLAQSLGLSEMKTEAQQIDPALFRQAGLDVPGTLTVMMLDTRATFDALVERLSPTPEKRDQILGNVLYKYISTSLAGTQEYMAMEKLYSVREDTSYDLILLDTPPTPNALDFLDAPERLIGAIDSAATRWFIQAFERSGKLSLNLLAKSTALVLRGIGRLTGSGFLEQIAAFLSEINALFGGWKKRADEIAQTLRGPEVAYVLVTTPDPLSVREVMFFAERLEKQRMQADAFVINRVHPVYDSPVSSADIAAATIELKARLTELDIGVIPKLLVSARDESSVGKADAIHLTLLESLFEGGTTATSLRAFVPAFPYDIHDLKGLSEIAAILVPAGSGVSR